MASLKEEIAAANQRADRERGKALGKRFGGLRTRDEKIRLLLDEIQRFREANTFDTAAMRLWEPLERAARVVKKDLEG